MFARGARPALTVARAAAQQQKAGMATLKEIDQRFVLSRSVLDKRSKRCVGKRCSRERAVLTVPLPPLPADPSLKSVRNIEKITKVRRNHLRCNSI